MRLRNANPAKLRVRAWRYGPDQIKGRAQGLGQTALELALMQRRRLRLSATNKCGIHAMATARMVSHLRSMALHVEVMRPHDPFDLLIDGVVRVAVRVALPSVHPVRVQVGKRHYQYQYRSWLFNFHHHARIDRYSDFLICLALDERRDLDPSDAYVIPWEARSGKTFSLHEGRRPYHGRYTPYRGAWEQLRGGRVIPAPATHDAHAVPCVAPSLPSRVRSAGQRSTALELAFLGE